MSLGSHFARVAWEPYICEVQSLNQLQTGILQSWLSILPGLIRYARCIWAIPSECNLSKAVCVGPGT
jgi:hypothetical protein